MKGVVSILAVVAATGLLAAGGAGASGINGINNGMPNRISMNVTVPKQTQGASFGEKVSSGLQAAGSAVAQGASLSLVVECGQAACAIAFPDGDGYRADTTRMTLQPLSQAQAQALRTGSLGQGASLLGGALPGGAIVSAAVSSVGALAGGGTQAAQDKPKGLVNGLFSIVIDQQRLIADGSYFDDVAELIAYVKASPSADPEAPVLVPGEPEPEALKVLTRTLPYRLIYDRRGARVWVLADR